MMASNSLCLAVVILTATNKIGSLHGLTCPGPVEEGSTVSLTCSTESTATALVWQLEVSGQFKDVSRCQVTQDCTNSMTPAFSATLDPSDTKNTQYDSVLTISRVSRNQNKFRCLNEICQLEVYVKPAKPQCVGDGAILGHRGLPYRSYLEVLCTTPSSYPRAKCTLNSTLSSNLVTKALPSYTYTPLGDGNYMTLCTYTMFLGGFQTGHYYFTLTMASDLSTFVPNAATAVEPQFTLTLFAPSLTLGSDCPEGIIKSGMSATCTCKMTHPGYPQGWVKWYTSSNRTTGSASGDDFTTITLTYNPQNPCPTYECSPESALGRLAPGLSYAPSFEENAGGCPSNKVIPTSPENPADLVPGISATVGCVVIALTLGVIVFICKKRTIPRKEKTPSTTDVNHSPRRPWPTDTTTGIPDPGVHITTPDMPNIQRDISSPEYDLPRDHGPTRNSDNINYPRVPGSSVSYARNRDYIGSDVNSIRSASENPPSQD